MDSHEIVSMLAGPPEVGRRLLNVHPWIVPHRVGPVVEFLSLGSELAVAIKSRFETVVLGTLRASAGPEALMCGSTRATGIRTETAAPATWAASLPLYRPLRAGA